MYLDASAWVKLYVPETCSDALNGALLDRRDLLVSDLGATEVASALGRACREARFDRVSGRRLLRKMRQHMVEGILQRLDLTLHVALASVADVATIVTYDPRVAAAARAAGIAVASPGTRMGG